MNRNDLAMELGVWPWNVDDWLLQGCPAKQLGKTWEFNLEKVRTWLQTEAIKIKRMPPKASAGPTSYQRWFRTRCPICMDRGFSGEKAGKVYTLGEVFDGEWHLRRTGIPCGHSAYMPRRREDPHTVRRRRSRGNQK